MTADPEDALEPAALSGQAGDDKETLKDAALDDAVLEDEALDDADEVERRDEHRWELDPASAEIPPGQR